MSASGETEMGKCKHCGADSEVLFEVVYNYEVCSGCQLEIEADVLERDEFNSLSEEY